VWAEGADSPATNLQRANSPNIVLIFADDLGFGDLGCYGQKRWKTPNIDSIASQGVRFTDFHSSQPVCSASRASLLTGCYANRIGIHGALGPAAKNGIHDDEVLISELLKSKGYKTCAVGKWHLNSCPSSMDSIAI
jgi:arylsulfatase